MQKIHAGWALALLLFLLTGRCLSADGILPADITIGGFGTLGAVYHDAAGLEFRRSVAQARGARAGEIDFATDSLFGLQVQAQFAPAVSIVVQGVTRLNARNDWRPELTRGFLRLAPQENFMLRAGRIGFEVYLQADALDVGYSYVPIRPPVEMFGSIIADHIDGADLTLTRPLAGGLGRVRVLGGILSGTNSQADGSLSEVRDTDIWGAVFDYLYSNWQLRAAFLQVRVGNRVALEPLIAALRSTGVAVAVQLADELALGRGNTFVGTLGVAYDRGPLQAQAVYVRLDSDSPPGPDLDSALVLLAYRHRALTPYVLFAVSDSFATVRPMGLAGSGPAVALEAAARQVQTAGQPTQRTLSAGVRYNFMPRMDLKLQIDRSWLRVTPLVFDRNIPPLDRASMTVFGLAIDFVF